MFNKNWVLAATLIICTVTMVFTSCTDNADNAVAEPEQPLSDKEMLMTLYGENKKITDGNYDKSLAVKCINGTFVGKRSGGIVAYKGIPFVGQQPVGELRWKAPVDYVADESVYEAYYNAKSPYQREEPSEKASLYVQGEDCLYLNIWKAEGSSAATKPVMVWIHGGAFEMGGTVDPWYEGHNFIQENPEVILVSIEYRLGIFGFFHLSHLPDGADYPDAQNLGLMDQMMALKWIHNNIAAFGGDPDNVTIFGESAGGGSVSLLPLIEGSHNYFQRVIAQSGSVCFSRSEAEAIACTNEVMSALGCKTVADLQKVDIEKLVEAADAIRLRVLPERDGKFLPLDAYEAYANGAAKDLDFMQGCNKDEMNYFLFCAGGPEPFMDFLKDVKGEAYDPLCRLYDQIWFIAPVFRQAENQTKSGGKSYTYFFTPESSLPLLRCGHSVELPVIFNHQEITLKMGWTFDATFSKTMRRMWVQFAKTGNPSLSADQSPDGKAKEWPLYDLENKQLT